MSKALACTSNVKISDRYFALVSAHSSFREEIIEESIGKLSHIENELVQYDSWRTETLAWARRGKWQDYDLPRVLMCTSSKGSTGSRDNIFSRDGEFFVHF
jgi:hypothetical protein